MSVPLDEPPGPHLCSALLSRFFSSPQCLPIWENIPASGRSKAPVLFGAHSPHGSRPDATAMISFVQRGRFPFRTVCLDMRRWRGAVVKGGDLGIGPWLQVPVPLLASRVTLGELH